MRISIIGAGRVADCLARELARQHHHIVQIFSRDLHRAQTLAAQVHAAAINDFSDLQDACELVIIAVSDSAIAECAAAVHQYCPNAIVAHTSGSTDIAVIAEHHPHAAVFYPLQTFSLGQAINWQDTPLLIEAAYPNDMACLNDLAHTVSQRVYAYSSAQRQSLHLAAVFACNFANYCFDAAAQITAAAQVDFALLHPLMLETAAKATRANPASVQTGPAVRGDAAILALHQDLLAQSGRSDLQQIYADLSRAIAERHAQ